LAAGFNSKSCRHVRFPRPSFAKEDDVAMVLDVVAAGQFPEQPSVQTRDLFGIVPRPVFWTQFSFKPPLAFCRQPANHGELGVGF